MSAPDSPDAKGTRDALPVTVMGLGLYGGGAAVARYFARRGARVVVTDLRDAGVLAPSLAALAGLDVELALGGHRPEHFEHRGLVVANPAVPPASPFLERARRSGARVTSELELFLERSSARTCLVTGTQGKSSTAHFLAQLLEARGARVHLGGNIGRSLLERAEELDPQDLCVLEVSSYQLEHLPVRTGSRARIEGAVLTNVLRDHLERHGTPQAYLAAKLRAFELVASAGFAVLPLGLAGELARTDLERLEHAEDPRDGARLRLDGPRALLDGHLLADLSEAKLAARFQASNLLLALAAAERLLAPAEEERALPPLSGLPHRARRLGNHGGRAVIDNGVSTTPDSTLSVLRELAGPCTLLCGGQAKAGLALDELAAGARARGDQVVAFGASAPALAAAFGAAGVPCELAADVPEAVELAFARTPPGGTLLFSPACASFDAYPNFEARARRFLSALPPPVD